MPRGRPRKNPEKPALEAGQKAARPSIVNHAGLAAARAAYLNGHTLKDAAELSGLDYQYVVRHAENEKWAENRETMARGVQKQVEQLWREVGAINAQVETSGPTGGPGIPTKEQADIRSKLMADLRAMQGAISLSDEIAILDDAADYFQKMSARYSDVSRRELSNFFTDYLAYRIRERQRKQKEAGG